MTDRRSEQALTLLEVTAAEHMASSIWALFSGGDDSFATALVTARAQEFRGCLHIDTGIGIPETQQFVRETCEREGWPLKVYKTPQSYDDLAVRYGFPGPAAHFRMYIRLKERALDAFVRDHKTHRHDRLILSTGARRQESTRRMGHVQQVQRDGVKVWVNALADWSKSDCLDAIGARPRNPVVELLHMSGECLCGCFAKPEELKEIALWFPHVGERIRTLEQTVKAAGHDGVWGSRPRPKRKRQPAVRDSAGRKVGPLCQQCELNYLAE